MVCKSTIWRRKVKEVDPDKIKAMDKKFNVKYRDEKIQYFIKHKEHYAQLAKEWAKKNPEKVKQNRRNANKGLRCAYQRGREIGKIKRMPKWLTSLQISQIKIIYNKCAEYRKQGLDFHVDHIIPLQGKTVSGLHVPWNLRIVTAKYNLEKSNKVV